MFGLIRWRLTGGFRPASSVAENAGPIELAAKPPGAKTFSEEVMVRGRGPT